MKIAEARGDEVDAGNRKDIPPCRRCPGCLGNHPHFCGKVSHSFREIAGRHRNQETELRRFLPSRFDVAFEPPVDRDSQHHFAIFPVVYTS
jgi:hypothetical protein